MFSGSFVDVFVDVKSNEHTGDRLEGVETGYFYVQSDK